MVIKQLAQTKKAPVRDFLKYLILVYGREKIGKSTLFSQFPDCYFISTEPGTKGLEIYETQVENWDELKQVVKLLKLTNKYPSVCIDTVDRAYDMCLDYVCRELNIDYPGEDEAGKEDFGKSWKAVKKEFMAVIHEIIRTGRGVGFTSHATETEIKTKSGERYTRIFPSMGKQARTAIEALVDFFFYADYMRDENGDTVRVLITQGDETVWAGSRQGIAEMPPIMPLLRKGGYQALVDAFNGRHKGIDPSTLRGTRTTGKAAINLVNRMKQPTTPEVMVKPKIILKKPIRRA